MFECKEFNNTFTHPSLIWASCMTPGKLASMCAYVSVCVTVCVCVFVREAAPLKIIFCSGFGHSPVIAL